MKQCHQTKLNEVSVFDKRSLKDIYREIQEVYLGGFSPVGCGL